MAGHAATSPVGATAGSFAVSPSGAATYSIPIAVPPGTNGMAPSISLNYNSQAGNGLVGMGWSIGGLSVIHRCGANIAIDGFKGGVNYDANDRFCLDGERLIWDAANGFYRTQHESWRKVSVVGSYFTVTTKDGTVMTYGGAADSQVLTQGKSSIIRVWALNRIQDPSGNYITFTYQNNGLISGEYFLTSIGYTGNVNAGVSPYNAVYFEYGARTDIVPQYEGGSIIQTTQRITRILTYTDSTLAREYRLSYDNSGAVGRSRLTSIQECGTDGVCLPATTFNWQDGSIGFNAATQWVQQGASEPAQMQYADVNGDGKVDSLYFDTSRSNQVWVGSSTGTAFAAASPWVSYSSSTPTQIQYADVNGDGRPDALYTDISGNRVLVSLSTGSGFNAPSGWATFSAYSSTLDPAQVQYADVDGDGRADLIYQGPDNAFRVALSSGMGFGTPAAWVQHGGSFTAGQAQYADVNGDDRADLIFQASGNSFWVSLSIGTGFTAPALWVQHGGGFTAGQARYADLNGDGKADLIFHGNDGQLWASLSTGAGFTAPAAWAQPTMSQPAASSGVSGSQGFTTVGSMSFTVPAGVYSLRVTMSGGGGGGGGGNNWGDWGSGGGGGGGYSQYVMAVTPGQVITGTVGAGGPAGCYSCSGGNGQNTIFSALMATGGQGGQYQCCGGAGGSPGGQPGSTSYSGAGGNSGAGQGMGGGSGSPGGIYGGGGGAGHTSSYPPSREGAQGWIYVEWVSTLDQVQYSDANGDGMADAVYFNVNDNSIWVYLSTGAGFLPGAMWGQLGPGSSVGSQIHYADVNGDGLPDALYFDTFRSNGVWVSTTKGVPPDLLASVTNGLGVVTQLTYYPLTTMGGNHNQAQYPYQDVQNATYVTGNVIVSDGVGGAQTTRYWYYGLKRHLLADASLGFARIQRLDPTGLVTDTYYNQTLDGTEGTVASSETWTNNYTGRVKYTGNTWTPVSLGGGRMLAILSSTSEQANDLNGAAFPGATATYSNFDTYYNPQTIAVSTTDGFTKTTANTYNNDTTNWFLGQLLRSEVTAQAPGQTRTSSFTYDSANRLTSETIEPDSTTLKLTSTYGYDAFGNRTKKTVSGPGITTRNEYVLTFDPRSQFVTTRKNALGHIERFENTHPTGALTKYTDANNLATTSTYDGFGRKERETRPDGTMTTINYGAWSGGTYVHTIASGAGENYVYSDILGRPVQTNTQGFGGNYTYKVTQYDNRGRVAKVSHPYFSGETVHYTEYAYDTLSRVTRVTEPGSAGSCNGPKRATKTTYSGLTTTITNPLCQAKMTVKNSHGQAERVTDAAGTVYYQYDPFGNLTQVTGVDGAVTSMIYDLRGHKIDMVDPDMGHWTYDYNVLDELIFQTDANGQTTAMSYDKLGRMSTRTAPDTISTWRYDTAAYGKGKLAAIYDGNATESYVYDSLSRLSSSTTGISGIAYTTGYTYDAYSRLLTLTYPTTGFKLYNVYDDYGHLTEVHQDTATGLRYWKADSFDAHGRLTQETFGNNLISTRAYDHATGDLQTIQTGTGTNLASVQNLSYVFDALGNLTSRNWWDGTTTRSEIFGYDSLNRLTSVAGPANKTYSYYPNGNIQFKSDVGTYSYTGPQPHALSQVAGYLNTTYTYDANGNLLTGNGRTIAYTSFNKPSTVTMNGTTGFTYDANFNRLTKSTGSGATTYIGKLYEEAMSGTTTTQKHHIYAGNNLVGMYTKNSNNTTNTQYFHTDHLGSVEVVTNAAGAVTNRHGYDAHGKRRYANGTDTSAYLFLGGARRGYTGHEHDDEVGLVNMNAREYDPLLGRFLTADTVVPGALDSQSYNRYSYVSNNPLSGTDPTGQRRLSLKKVFKVAVAVVAAVYVGPLAAGLFEGSVIGTAITVGAVGGATSGYVMTGNSDGVKAGAKGGAVSGGLFAEADMFSQNWGTPGQMAARSTAAGLTAKAQGGSFSQGFQTSFGIESFNQAALYMRDTAWRWASANPDNLKGPSSGLWGDGRKLAGSWPGADGSPICAPLGCTQGGAGKFFDIPYGPNGPTNFVLEAFSGPHDFLDRPLYNLETGNLQSWANGFGGYAYAALTIAPAAPFAFASMVQPIQQFLYPLQNLQ